MWFDRVTDRSITNQKFHEKKKKHIENNLSSDRMYMSENYQKRERNKSYWSKLYLTSKIRLVLIISSYFKNNVLLKTIIFDVFELKNWSLIFSFRIIIIRSENHLIRINDTILCFFERVRVSNIMNFFFFFFFFFSLFKYWPINIYAFERQTVKKEEKLSKIEQITNETCTYRTITSVVKICIFFLMLLYNN